MALPTSGNITLAQVNTELGNSSSAAISLNNTNVRNLANKPSGAISMTDLYGATWVVISANTTNYNLFTSLGSPSTARRVIVTINAGVTVGATAGNTAFTVGQFPSGSTIQINNNGSIQGYGGTAGTSTTGGSGGDALNANYPNQTVVINNNAGATIYGGGGGGGKGGTGGTGGTGGQGYYTSTVQLGGSQNCTSSANQSCVNTYGGGAYCSGSNSCKGGYYCGCNYSGAPCCFRNNTYYTSGGAGGGGGAGGNGGQGQGYGQSNTNGSTGAGGSAGAAGGTNAGAGGTGGTGGTGGNGGTWGNAGGSGATGNTGSTGASGNYTGGSAGSAGAGGYSGGSAGRYLVKGSNSVTLNNSGTVAGGLA